MIGCVGFITKSARHSQFKGTSVICSGFLHLTLVSNNLLSQIFDHQSLVVFSFVIFHFGAFFNLTNKDKNKEACRK